MNAAKVRQFPVNASSASNNMIDELASASLNIHDPSVEFTIGCKNSFVVEFIVLFVLTFQQLSK